MPLQDVVTDFIMPTASLLWPNGGWEFAVDNAPSHSAKSTMAMLSACGVKQISPAWPPHSPDLHPADYAVHGILEQVLAERTFKSDVELKCAVTKAMCETITPELTKKIVDEWPMRLQRCLAAGGGHFEL